ncbi:MAG: hypothetical protein CBB67_005920 [Alteromonadaceae bacterium TMED7]|uniref:hypothetical protein n=1 Tax=Alteromonas sp. TaxID=232 RepID=UPI000B6F544E|nr:hypothetical protein [Alteromonas sp.]RPH20500.1 MAG: hypothetical protein CBB67_005920 [Alteromonadaceae bacterium TMED7]|tara:strand:- start:15485 stop:17404 length:1920 start_codon:yes stop_codon:yes gene_type:complete
MAVKKLTELEFDQIKTNLKTFLSDQSQYSDYDFEASGLSVLMDLLAYNTQYNAMLAHMVTNEAFLDSAVKRSSVASIAKTMGYTARSARASAAVINLSITNIPSTYSSSSFSITKERSFTASSNGKTFKFYPDKDYTVNRTTVNGVDGFYFTDMRIVEGVRVDNSEIVDASSLSGPVLMANPAVDTTTLSCTVQESISDSTSVTFTFSDNILDVKSTSNVFYVEESLNGFYEVRFGDGVIGRKLEAGNIVRLNYIAASGPAANGIKNFTPPSTFIGSGETVSLTLVSESSGGAVQESVDSIRFNAPRFNATKNRAVTTNDYQALILSANPNVKSVAVWGGEDNDPPIYGKVFISLQAKPGLVITQDDKDNLLRETIEPRQPVSITAEFVDPEFTYIGLNLSVTYDSKTTTLTQGALQTLVQNELNNYFDTQLNALDRNFYYSVLSSRLVQLSNSFIAVNIEVRLQKRLTPSLNTAVKYTLPFNNKIQPYSVSSGFFNAKIDRATYSVYIADVPNDDVVAPAYNGKGTIILKTSDKNVIVDANAGTIDYDTGKIEFNALNIQNILGSYSNLSVTCQPHESAKDIKTDVLRRTAEVSDVGAAVVPTPSKNYILAQDNSAADIPNNIRAGTKVSLTARVLDS